MIYIAPKSQKRNRAHRLVRVMLKVRAVVKLWSGLGLDYDCARLDFFRILPSCSPGLNVSGSDRELTAGERRRPMYHKPNVL